MGCRVTPGTPFKCEAWWCNALWPQLAKTVGLVKTRHSATLHGWTSLTEIHSVNSLVLIWVTLLCDTNTRLHEAADLVNGHNLGCQTFQHSNTPEDHIIIYHIHPYISKKIWLVVWNIFPHIFVWGSCFWFCIPPSASSRRRLLLTHNLSTHNLLTHTQLAHTQLVHTQLAHTQLTQTQLVHTQLAHTQVTHTHNLSTHNLLTHNLLTHNLLTHNLSTRNLLTHNLSTHNLSTHNLSTHNLHTHTTCPHTTYSHTTCSNTSAWQAWHLGTCSSTLRGRRGTLRHPPSFHVAGVVLGHIDFQFAWQAWHVWHRAGSGGVLGSRTLRGSSCTLRGRRGTLRHPPSFHVAGVVFGHIDFHFAWQVWHVWHRAGSGGALGSQVSLWAPRLFAWQAWHLATCSCTLRGRRGTSGTGLALVARLVLRCRRGRRGFLRDRRGTWRHVAALWVAGTALGDM